MDEAATEINKEIKAEEKKAEQAIEKAVKEEKIGHMPHRHSRKAYLFWRTATFVLIVLVLFLVYMNGLPTLSSDQSTVNKAVEYINANLLEGTTATLLSYEKVGGLYKLTLLINGMEFESYTSKDGSLLFPTGIELVETETPETIGTAFIGGVENGKCVVPSVNLWSKAGGYSEGGVVSSTVEGCVGLPVQIIGKETVSGAVWYHVQTYGENAGKSGWVAESLTTQTATTEPARADVTIAEDDPVYGPADAKVTIIEFSDFQCPYCARAKETMDEVLKAYEGQIKFVFKQFPLGFHENAQKAAEASECANEQGKFWEYYDKLFSNQDALAIDALKSYAQDLGLNTEQFNACLDSGAKEQSVKEDIATGTSAGVSGTPAFFINGKKLVGAQPFSSFKEIIDEELGQE